MSTQPNKWNDVRKARLTPEQLEDNDAWVLREIVELNLRELREAAGLTQVEVATAAEMTQGELSRAERRNDHLVSTLRRYVEALGGEVEIVATINGKRVRLVGV